MISSSLVCLSHKVSSELQSRKRARRRCLRNKAMDNRWDLIVSVFLFVFFFSFNARTAPARSQRRQPRCSQRRNVVVFFVREGLT